ncbi:MAG: division/cell wall cluster transcriptional repressor MraZ [Chitinivibrionales bacterium]|nr:division/cell wall cluster transcriptional repressor MraZ [Chitinivibrionales bacterium]
MSRFRGKFEYSIDAKGRVSMPAKFRRVLNPEAQETFVICLTPNKCLRAYPLDAWEKYEDELASRPETHDTLRFKRFLYDTAADSTLDKQGRILIAPNQIKLAGIAKEIILVGHMGYIEMWAKEAYESYFLNMQDYDETYFKSVEAGLVAR